MKLPYEESRERREGMMLDPRAEEKGKWQTHVY